MTTRTTGDGLRADLDRWSAAGLISGAQAADILAAERHTAAGPPPGRTAPLVAEALGYVGGILLLVGTGTLVGRYWADLGAAGRLAVALGASALLLVTGAAAPDRLGAARDRLRAVCWVLSAATFAAGLALLGAEVLDAPDEDVAVLAGAGAAGYAGLLWWRHRGPLQHAALVAALAVTAGAAAARLPAGEDAVAGLAVWGVGAAWLMLGGGRVVDRYPAYVSGAVAAVVGGQLAMEAGWGGWLAAPTAAVLVVAGVRARDLVLLGVGAAATLVTVPAVVSRYFPDTLAAPLALLATGAVLVFAALGAARRRPAGGTARARPARTGTAVVLAVAVALAATAAVVGLGLR